MAILFDASSFNDITWYVNNVAQSGNTFYFNWGDEISYTRSSGRTQSISLNYYDKNNTYIDNSGEYETEDSSGYSFTVPFGTTKIEVDYFEDNELSSRRYIGKIYYQLSTLANTKWVFNSEITISSSTSFDINFVSHNQNWTNIELDAYDGLIYSGNGLSNTVYGVAWYDQEDRIIEITGGTDVTNSDLITWLEANATLQTATYKTFDLSTLQLSAGTHEVKVRARGSGYRDSNFSNSVTYTKTISRSVTITIENQGGGTGDWFRVYDGQDRNGTLLYGKDDPSGSNTIASPITVVSTTGYLYIELAKSDSNTWIIASTQSANISPQQDPWSNFPEDLGILDQYGLDAYGQGVVFTLSGDGTINFERIKWFD